MSGVTIEPVRPREMAFHRLPLRLQGGDPCYVPPLLLEERRQLDPRVNPHFREAEIALWIARRDGRPVGRISAHIDRVALAHAGDSTGFFGHWEVEDDAEVAEALLAAAEAWLRARGMERVRGPFEVSVNDRCGLLVEGREE